jgi:hypothetical protein
MPNLDDIIWAVITSRDPTTLREALSGGQAYIDVISNGTFLEILRYHPEDLNVNEIRFVLIEFLNKWGCRLRNYDNLTASNLKACIVSVHHELLPIQENTIVDFNFETTINKEKIINIFNKFWSFTTGSKITKNFGSTATSKTLHIINPNLFTMWDSGIRYHYGFFMESGNDYLQFLVEIKRTAENLVDECNLRFEHNNLALWLSEKLNINPPHSLTKFIDEFNWLAYKRELIRPPDWVCPF